MAGFDSSGTMFDDPSIAFGVDTDVTRPADPPDPQPIRPARSARWRFVIATPDGQREGELTLAQSRTVTFKVDGAHEASCAIPARSPQARLVAEYATDLLCYRDDALMFRGRIGRCPLTVSPNVKTLTVNAVSYRGVLDRRRLFADRRYDAADQADILWDLIAYTQALPGGNLGITRGAGHPTGIVRDRSYEAGKSIGEAATQLGQVIDGFDWDIDANLVATVWHPTRGTYQGPIDFGAIVASYTRNPAGEYATSIYATGAETTAPVTVAAADIATRATGRFDHAIADPDLSRQSTLQERADWTLARTEQLRHAYYLTLSAGRWSPETLYLGDTFRFVDLDQEISVLLRAVEIGVSAGDDGGEQVTVHGEPT